MKRKIAAMTVAVFVYLSSLAPLARAADIFVAATSAGANNGSDCADARAYSSLIAGDYSGNRIRICGTITGAAGSTLFTVGAANATILFETGAILQAPYFAGTGGAINCNGQTGLTVDGGTNGIIRNTADGTALTYQQNSKGVDAGQTGCSGFTAKNLHISTLYIRTQNSTDGVDTTAISMEGNNSLATANTIDHSRVGVFFGYQSSSNVEISFNVSTFTEVAVIIGDLGPGAALTGAKLHNNDWGGGAYLWDSPSDMWHHNGAHLWSVQVGSTGFTGLQVYDNYMHGVWGADTSISNSHITAGIYLETVGDGAQAFNNRVVLFGVHNQGDNGSIFCKGSGTPAESCRNATIVNNTVVGDGTGGKCFETTSTGTVFKNNICSQIPYAVYTPNGETSTIITSNNNDYFGASQWGAFDSFSGWQTKGFDVNGVIGNPLLDSNYSPTTGSAAFNVGANLTSLGISALNVDANGTPRPTTGVWTAGAFNGGPPITPNSPLPPTGLTAVPH